MLEQVIEIAPRNNEDPLTLEPSLSDLVSDARLGNRLAFGELYRRFARMMHGIVLANAPANVADDLVQDVFLTALNQLANLRINQAFGDWLATIARNRAIDYNRQSKKVLELAQKPISTNTSKLEATAILAAIHSLPDCYREPLVLRLVEGMTGPEIAEQTGLPPDSVRVNLHRGMKLLRSKLQERDKHE